MNSALLIDPPLRVTRKELNALLLELVEVFTLVVPSYTNLPLLKLADEALLVLDRHPRVVTLCARILHAYHVAVLRPSLLNGQIHGVLVLVAEVDGRDDWWRLEVDR